MSVDEHRLQPLLAPRSIALVGASSRYGSVGEMMVRQLIEGGYTGDIYPVNPRYQELNGLRCYGSLGELPAGIELTVLNLAGHRIEATLNESLGHGTKAFVIFDPCRPPEDTSPSMVERLRALARETGIPICGANGMGYSNFDARCFVGMWVQPEHPPGPVTLIAHSGSVFCFANAPAPNYFNLSVSLGQELGTSSQNKISINRSGFVMGGLHFMEIHYKDSERFPDGFNFYTFDNDQTAAAEVPLPNDCVACHKKDGAYDGVFVQFYPTIHDHLPADVLEKLSKLEGGSEH